MEMSTMNPTAADSAPADKPPQTSTPRTLTADKIIHGKCARSDIGRQMSLSLSATEV